MTLTELTLPAVTFTVDVPVAPPAAAVIVALPAFFAVTTPLEDTVATALFEVDHAASSSTTLPAASVSLAESWLVAPLASEINAGVTATLFTAPAETMTVALPVAPFADAEIVVLPMCSAVTTPLLETVAMLLLALDQSMLCAESALPASSSSEAVSCCVFPACNPSEPGAIVIVATPPAPT